MRTLREALPRLEADWLLPAWCIVAITVAAIAETITIGVGVRAVYHLETGWAVGGVVASAQAIGSLLWSRAVQHNAGRRIRWKLVGPRDHQRRVEDTVNSEPCLNVAAPAIVSLAAGVISAWIGAALYGVDGSTTGLDVAMAIASPAGSIAAAVLNGVFSYGEAALAEWRSEQSGKMTGHTTGRPADRPELAGTMAGHTKEPPEVAGHAARRTKRQEAIQPVSLALAGHLSELRNIIAGNRQDGGEADGHFTRADVEQWLSISNTHAKNVLAYGLEHGLLERSPSNTYHFRS